MIRFSPFKRCLVHGMFSTLGVFGIISTSGGYHEYIGDVQYIGGYHDACGGWDAISTSGGYRDCEFSTWEGNHEYIGRISWVHGVFSA